MSDIRPDDTTRRLDDIDQQLRELDLKLGQATLQEQRRDEFLRRRAGWILFWVVLLVLGSCGYTGNQSNDVSNQLDRIESQLDENRPAGGVARDDDVKQLCRLLGQVQAKQGVAPAPPSDGTDNECYAQALEGYKTIKPAKK